MSLELATITAALIMAAGAIIAATIKAKSDKKKQIRQNSHVDESIKNDSPSERSTFKVSLLESVRVRWCALSRVWKITTLILCTTFMVILCILAIFMLASTSDNTTEQRGNSLGNIKNGGVAAIEDEWIYFSDTFFTWGIVKMSYDGSVMERLTDSLRREDDLTRAQLASSLNVFDGWIFYNDTIQFFDDAGIQSQEFSLSKMRTDGSDSQLLSNDHASCINVVDGWIYYRNLSDNQKIYKMKIDGTQRQMLVSERTAWPLYVTNGWMYFYTEGQTSGLWRAKTDGSHQEKISDAWLSNFIVEDGWMYYDSDGDIYRLSVDGKLLEKIASGRSSNIVSIADGWIYFTDRVLHGDISAESESVFYRMKTDGTKKQRLSDDCFTNMRAVSIVGSWIYFGMFSDEEATDEGVGSNHRHYRMRTDGSDRQVVIFPDAH